MLSLVGLLDNIGFYMYKFMLKKIDYKIFHSIELAALSLNSDFHYA